MTINEMKPGNDNVHFQAIIAQVTTGKTNGANKSNYLNIVLQDATGHIDAKLWSATDAQIKTFSQGTVVNGVGDIIRYNNNRQMKIISLEVVDMSEEDKVIFLPKAPVDADQMMREIETFIRSIHNIKLYSITHTLFDTYASKLKVYPAASRNHHEFVSGLLFHTLTMVKTANALCQIYPDLNRDLLIAGTVLHDIGKIFELSGPVTPTYTLEGNLLGHITIGENLIAATAKDLNIEGEEILLLQHLVLSHHGKNEYGSPILPAIKEAEVLFLIDNIDARINMFNKALEDVEPGEFSKRIFALENRMVYKPKLQ